MVAVRMNDHRKEGFLRKSSETWEMFLCDRFASGIYNSFLRFVFRAILFRPFIRGSIAEDLFDDHKYSFANGRDLGT